MSGRAGPGMADRQDSAMEGEDLRNDFETACNERDYAKAAELLRVARIECTLPTR